LLVSLPPAYPASAPPQLQILSRYIGAFQVDAFLFGKVLKTYISSGRVEFVPGEAAVFDGVENARDVIQKWYEDHLIANAAAESLREDEKGLGNLNLDEDVPECSALDHAAPDYKEPEDNTALKVLDSVQIYASDPVHDRKSTFVGRACRITNPEQVHGLFVATRLHLTHLKGSYYISASAGRQGYPPSYTSGHKRLAV
jgi:hypothetical protein